MPRRAFEIHDSTPARPCLPRRVLSKFTKSPRTTLFLSSISPCGVANCSVNTEMHNVRSDQEERQATTTSYVQCIPSEGRKATKRISHLVPANPHVMLMLM